MRRERVGAAVAAALAMVVAGCGGDDNDSTGDTGTTSVKLSGVLSTTSYSVASKPTLSDRLLAFLLGEKAIAVGETVDQVWAVPVASLGSDLLADFDDAVKSDVAADGSFSLSVSPDLDWVLVLVNSQAAARKDQLVSYVSVADTANQISLLVQPISDIEEGEEEVAYGTVAAGTGDAADEAQTQADPAAIYSAFAMTVDQLKELATVDDVFKSIKNDYINTVATDSGTQTTRLGMFFNWRAAQNLLVAAPAQDGTPASLADVSDDTGSYQGYWFRLHTTKTLDESGICNDTDTVRFSLAAPPGETLSIVDEDGVATGTPPAAVDNSGDLVAGPAASGGTGVLCSDTYMVIERNTDDHGDERIDLGIGGNYYIAGAVPAGWWVASYDENGDGQLAADGSEEFAWFDLNSAYPFDSAGNPTIYIPAPTVTLDGDHISRVSVTWYRWDNAANSDAGGWIEADPTVMSQLIGRAYVELKDFAYSGGAGASVTAALDLVSGSVSASDFVESTWSWSDVPAGSLWLFDATGEQHSDTSDNFDAQVIDVVYNIGGNEYHFNYIPGL